MTATLVRAEYDGDVAVLVLDNPPVNASSAALRRALLKAMAETANDEVLSGVVLIGADEHLMAGSDLSEFSAADVPDPQLPEVLAAIEEHPLPVVAALSGATLGGGFELALACDRRIALDGGTVGLPEAGLGMIPGAGGIVRTLRLLEPDRLLDLVLSAKPVSVTEAVAASLVDEVVSSGLRERAVDIARKATKRVLVGLPPREAVPGGVEDAMRRSLPVRGPAVTAAAAGAVLVATALPATAALQHERAEFTRLRRSPEARARRHLFFAGKAAARAAKPDRERSVSAVGVVGAGTMGAGIARAFVSAGVEVTLVDRDEIALERARTQIGRDGTAALARLHTSAMLADLASCDLVVEAVIEDRQAKKAVLAEVATIVDPAVPLATNTSYLDIDELATGVPEPCRVLGMHFLAPAHRTSVLEVVRATRTTPEALDHVLTAGGVLGKLPIVVGVCPGFAGNRIFAAYRRQAEFLVEEGASPSAVDDALVSAGMAMGPFAVADMSGLDVAWRARQGQVRDPRERYADIADRLVEEGRLGQKTGAGWYRYEPGQRVPMEDPAVADIIERARADKGIVARGKSSGEIVDRVLSATANEAALVLAEGIAARAGDIDLLLARGYGFPATLGGPCHWAANKAPEEWAESQRRLGESVGWGFVAGDAALLGQGSGP